MDTHCERLADRRRDPAPINNQMAHMRRQSPLQSQRQVWSSMVVDYNSEIDRVKCEIAFQIDGAERTNMIAMLEGQGPQRKVAYFVQPGGSGKQAISW